jgi:ADP-ribose pyrophosphatase YjhB (NUDIX family)
MSTRRDYYNDPSAPKANRLLPAASAIVSDGEGRILLHLRADSQLWGLPGGTMELGESIGQAVVREVKEETGLRVRPDGIVGVYSDPRSIVAFSDGEVRQQFSVCFACTVLSGRLKPSSESLQLGFFTPGQIRRLPMPRATRLRIRHYLAHRAQPYFS